MRNQRLVKVRITKRQFNKTGAVLLIAIKLIRTRLWHKIEKSTAQIRNYIHEVKMKIKKKRMTIQKIKSLIKWNLIEILILGI